MKELVRFHILAVSSCAVLFFAGIRAQAQTFPVGSREVIVAVNDVFVPSNVTSAMEASVVVSGMFPNSCYRWKSATVDHTTAYLHEIRAKAMVSEGMCLMVLVPFTKEVGLGSLKEGSHTLRFINGDGTYSERSLSVR